MRPALVGLALAFTLAASPARAEDVYDLSPELDLPLIGFGLAGAALVLVETAPPACLPECDSDRIEGFDRVALGHYSEDAYTAADIVVFSSLVFPVAAGLLDDGLEHGGESAVVLLESALLAAALTQLVKAAVDREAPLVYDQSVPADAKSSRDAARSFISGHATVVSAALTTANVTLWSKKPGSALAWSGIAFSAAAVIGVSVLKILAGYHYPTDVIAGALAGAATGALNAFAHK